MIWLLSNACFVFICPPHGFPVPRPFSLKSLPWLHVLFITFLHTFPHRMFPISPSIVLLLFCLYITFQIASLTTHSLIQWQSEQVPILKAPIDNSWFHVDYILLLSKIKEIRIHGFLIHLFTPKTEC